MTQQSVPLPVSIIDTGSGNLRSIQNMLLALGVPSLICGSATSLQEARAIILPGVGHFAYTMKNLRRLKFVEVLNEHVLSRGTPLLGICLGAQLLGLHSEEGDCEGLGFIPMKIVGFDRSLLPTLLRVPHMGWSDTSFKTQSTLGQVFQSVPRFYYVHSYHFQCQDSTDIICQTNYGYDFATGVSRGNTVGVQFHPEKSHKFGMQLLKSFISSHLTSESAK